MTDILRPSKSFAGAAIEGADKAFGFSVDNFFKGAFDANNGGNRAGVQKTGEDVRREREARGENPDEDVQNFREAMTAELFVSSITVELDGFEGPMNLGDFVNGVNSLRGDNYERTKARMKANGTWPKDMTPDEELRFRQWLERNGDAINSAARSGDPQGEINRILRRDPLPEHGRVILQDAIAYQRDTRLGREAALTTTRDNEGVGLAERNAAAAQLMAGLPPDAGQADSAGVVTDQRRTSLAGDTAPVLSSRFAATADPAASPVAAPILLAEADPSAPAPVRVVVEAF